jgi:GNAT superfamily N-acetyltransferase
MDTDLRTAPPPDAVVIRDLAADRIADRLPDVVDVYTEVYREPPYEEGQFDIDGFAENLPEQRHEPGFAMVTAESAASGLVGFAYGFTFPAGHWWGHSGAEPAELDGLSKFAVLEFAVRRAHRGQGIGTRLMARLLEGRPEPIATLCAHPAALARRIYESWGWVQVAVARWPNTHPSDVLIRPLPEPSPPDLAGR